MFAHQSLMPGKVQPLAARAMFSSLTILLGFAAILSLLNHRQAINDAPTRVIIAFIGSLSILSSLYFGLLLLSHELPWAPRATIFTCWFLLAGTAAYNKAQAKSALGDISQTSGWRLINYQRSASHPGVPATESGKTLYRRIFATSCFIIIFANIVNSSPAIWDSNTYNVARVASMIAERSPFLDQTSVARQAVLSISHDILFYPDILLGNTRGLGLVGGLEFIALICVASQISFHFVSQLLRSSIPLKSVSVYPALTLTLCLLIASDMQAMQSVITKNDLIITLCFTCGIYLACKYLSAEIDLATLMSTGLLITVYSLSSKSYGIISILPFASSLLVAVKRSTSSPIRSVIDAGSLHSSSKHIDSTTLSSTKSSPLKAYIAISLLAACIIQLIVDHSIKEFAITKYPSEVFRLADSYTITGKSAEEAFGIFCLNLARNILSMLFYPLTSLPYPGTDISHVSDRFTRILHLDILELSTGTAKNTSFLWPGYGPDTSYTSIFVIASLGLAWAAWFKLKHIYSVYTISAISCLHNRLSKLFLLIFANCATAFAVVSFVILYQPWNSRFFGSAYVPLIPISSFILAQYIHLTWPKLTCQRFVLYFKFVIPALSLLMLISHISISTLGGDIKLAFSPDLGSIPLSERRYARHIARTANVEPIALSNILTHIRDAEYKYRVICTSEDGWTLSPILSSMENQSYNGRNLSSAKLSDCIQSASLSSNPKPVSTEGKAQYPTVITNGDTEYILLP